MTRSFESRLTLLAAWMWLASSGTASAVPPETTYHIVSVEMSGLERTDPDWLESYVDYQFPAELTEGDIQRLQRKLMTTGVFTDVKIVPEPSLSTPGGYRMHVLVDEKWTTIPVIRGVYGGGTPLRILGMYDIHSFGRLLTLGAEMRRYGDAPPGFVVYGRDPRSHAGRYYLGAEFWRDFHRRTVYDREGERLGAVSTNASISRVKLLTPLSAESGSYAWKYGFDFEVVQEAPSVFDPEGDEPKRPPKDLTVSNERRIQTKALPTLLFDDIEVNTIEFDGLRAKLKAGPLIDRSIVHSTGELETFYYKILPRGWNVGVHAVAGQSTFNSLQSQYFLGGLDSIRGLSDGALYGTHATWANAELRHLFLKSKYLWLQNAMFVDAGGAGETWRDASRDVRATAGVGLRFAVPQVYRLLLRIDYAWSIDGSHSQGVTAGMNQFFEPYTPL